MRLFCSALEHAKRRGARLAIAAAHPAVRRELERSASDGVELYPTLSAAVASAGHTHRPLRVPRQTVRQRRAPDTPRVPTFSQ